MPLPEQQGDDERLTAGEMLPKPIRVLGDVGPETATKIARQSRPLTAKESQHVRNVFGDSLDPMQLRLGYDSSISGTNLRGYVLHRNVPVAFFPADGTQELPESFFHEYTHIWQHNTKAESKGGIPYGVYDINSDAARNLSFDYAGPDQQAERVSRAADASPEYLKNPFDTESKETLYNIRSRKGTDPESLGNAAFLESLAQHENKAPSDDLTARMGSIRGIKAISRKGGRLSETREDYSASRKGLPEASSSTRRPTQNELDAMAPLAELVSNPQDVSVLRSDTWGNAAMRLGNDGYRTVTFPPTQTIAPQEPEMDYDTSTHEFAHIAQGQGLPAKGGLQFWWDAVRDKPGRYEYGGTDGLESMLKKGQSVTDLNPEQQASALTEYAHLKRVADAFPGTLTDSRFKRKFLIHEQMYRQALAAKSDDVRSPAALPEIRSADPDEQKHLGPDTGLAALLTKFAKSKLF